MTYPVQKVRPVRPAPATPEDHGLPWSSDDLAAVVGDYLSGMSIQQLAEKFGRTTESIRCKIPLALQDTGGYVADVCPQMYRDRVAAATKAAHTIHTNIQSTQEKQVKIVIETKTFINGSDVAALTNDQLFKFISDIENEVKRLSAIEHKPKALQAQINALNCGIIDIVEICDARLAREGGAA